MTDSDETGWMQWFCKQRGNEFFTMVDEDYIRDKFNLIFLDTDLRNYRSALDVILGLNPGSRSDNGTQSEVEESAEKLYGMIHARFILTDRGIDLMIQKFQKGVFGTCPRVFCHRQHVLPIGLSDTPGEEMVSLYCPKCNDIYIPKSARHRNLDGAFFGTNFPQMLFMVNPEARPKRSKSKFVPRLYGFKIHPLSHRTEAQKDLQETDI